MARRPRFVYNLEITDVAEKAMGVGRREDGRVVFVKGVVPGDVVDVRIRKSKKSYQEGFVVQWHKKSDLRVEAQCQHFNHCGGCQWQHIRYEDQLQFKEGIVKNAMRRIGKVEIEEWLPILGAPDQYYYRNKLEFGCSSKKWLPTEALNDDSISNVEDVMGFHVSGAYDKILDIEKCHLQPDPSNDLRNGIKKIAIEQGIEFYDSRNRVGFFRQMMIRLTTTGEIMLLLSFAALKKDLINPFLDQIIDQFPSVTSVFYCINDKVNDFMFDLEMKHYWGAVTITEQLNHVKFKIGPKSFFQTNTKQGVQLFDVVAKFAGLTGEENVYDLYTGIGSIAQYVAKDCKQVVAIEEIEAAVEDAKVNADLNKIDNCIFYAGDVKNILTHEFKEKHGAADVLITDPPRAGMHPKVVDMLLELEAPRVVYVSCNPSTQARDLQMLSTKYTIKKMQPVDMFPNTYHIENVALLELKN